MKVALVHNRYRVRGGEDVVFEREADWLKGAGLNVQRYVRDSAAIGGAASQIEVAANLPFSHREAIAFSRYLERVNPDLVHVHNYFPIITPAVFAVCRAAKVPVVHTLHNFRLFCANGLLLREGKPCLDCLAQNSPWPGLRHGCYQDSRLRTLPVSRLIQRNWRSGFLAENVDAFLCTTEFAREIFIRAGLPARMLTVKPNFSPDLRDQYVRRPQNYALYLGRLSEEKGIRNLLRAWPGAKQELTFVGDGPLSSLVEAAGHKLHRNANPAEVFRLLAGAKFLVMPTECFESGIPLVLLEAMSLGIPVIASRFGAVAEVFEAGKNAWLFPAGEEAALREAILDCDADQGRRESIGAQGRATYEARFTPERAGEILLATYSSLLRASTLT